MNTLSYTGKKAVIINRVLLLVGLAMAFLPRPLMMDMMDGGYALIFIGAFLSLTTLVLTPFLEKRAQLMGKIHQGQGVLAWWRYPNTKWEKQKEKEIADLFPMMTGGIALGAIFLLIGVVVFFVDMDENAGFLGIMALVAIFFVGMTQVLARTGKKRLNKMENEAVIHENGLYFMGSLTTFGSNHNKLEAVGFDTEHGDALDFYFIEFRRGSGNHQIVSIPIPSGEENTAAKIISYYNKPVTEEIRSRY